MQCRLYLTSKAVKGAKELYSIDTWLTEIEVNGVLFGTGSTRRKLEAAGIMEKDTP